MNINLDESWKNILKESLESEIFKKLWVSLQQEYQQKEILPSQEKIFAAFNATPWNNLKVVVIGQDPYHTPDMAEGLAFSVPKHIKKIPPSIRNIFQEISADINIETSARNGNLESWAEQGVLLLNQVLTVQAHVPGSHWKKGWEEFTSEFITKISREKKSLVFILWGSRAQQLKKYINRSNTHLVLEALHPSPLSAYRGFFGCRHFSQTNAFLKKNGKKEIDW